VDWLVSNIKNLSIVFTYLKGVSEDKLSTARFHFVIDEDFLEDSSL
jgi:hypothetical protein